MRVRTFLTVARSLSVALALTGAVPATGASAANLAAHPCFDSVSHGGPGACLTKVFGSTDGYEAVLLRGAIPVSAPVRMDELARLRWIPGRFTASADPAAIIPEAEMFALHSNVRCAVISATAVPDSAVTVRAGSNLGVAPRAYAAAHENGHCSMGFLEGRGARFSGINDESFADIFVIWLVASSGGPDATAAAAKAVLDARRDDIAGGAYARIPAEVSAFLAKTGGVIPGEGFASFLTRGGACQGGPCAAPRATLAATVPAPPRDPSVRVGWHATTNNTNKGEDK
jgi:hypothetical protein